MFSLAIYGGTFAPVHNGHISAVREYCRLCSPDKLLVIPTSVPPHKQLDFCDNAGARLEMLRLAFPDDPVVSVSEYELSNSGVSYTVNTLSHFAAPDTELTFICGTDMFLTLDSWRDFKRIFALARIALIRREMSCPELDKTLHEAKDKYISLYGARIVFLDAAVVEISSTELRQRIREGRDISGSVPAAIAGYIRQHNIFLN